MTSPVFLRGDFKFQRGISTRNLIQNTYVPKPLAETREPRENDSETQNVQQNISFSKRSGLSLR